MKTIIAVAICLAIFAGCASTPTETRGSAGAENSAVPKEGTDITGHWLLDVVSSLGSGTATFDFKQAGETLTGEYSGMFGILPVTGTIKGDEIAFSFIADAGGQKETIAYSGTVKQNSMFGNVALGNQGSGTFNGTRN